MRLIGPICYFVGGLLIPPGHPVNADAEEAERLKKLGFVEASPATAPGEGVSEAQPKPTSGGGKKGKKKGR